MSDKPPSVIIVISGDPKLAKDIRWYLDLMLDWETLDWDQLLKARPFLKKSHIDKPTEGGFRLVFLLTRKMKRPDKGEKAGFTHG